jgi:glutaredoxin
MTPTRVTLLTQPDCSLCEHAKQVLARVAAEHPLQVTEIDLASTAGHELALTARVLFAPGVFLDGEPFSHGRLSERKLRRALAAQQPTPAAMERKP